MLNGRKGDFWVDGDENVLQWTHRFLLDPVLHHLLSNPITTAYDLTSYKCVVGLRLKTSSCYVSIQARSQ